METIRAVISSALRLLTLLLFISGLSFFLSPQSAASSPEIYWTYQDRSGPDHWAELDSSFAACTTGQAQSPINLVGTPGLDLPDLAFHYESVPLNLLNNGHTIQLPYAPGSYLTLDGKAYNLLQLHFHSPSEHTIDSKPASAELHLVHKSDDGEIAVVAVLLQPSLTEASSAYPITTDLPQKFGDKIRTNKTINARLLLPEQTTTYRYSGSLTTPPCTESVYWLIMTEPVALPPEQLSYYRKILNNNNRPLQRLNKRTIQTDSQTDSTTT